MHSTPQQSPLDDPLSGKLQADGHGGAGDHRDIRPLVFLRERFARVEATLAEMRTEQREQRGRIAAMERSLAHIERDGAEQRAELGGRFDRVLDRLDRIERRLDLVDGPAA